MINKIDYSKLSDEEFILFLNDIGIDSDDIEFNKVIIGVIFSEEMQ